MGDMEDEKRKRSSPLEVARQILLSSKEHCRVSTRDFLPTFGRMPLYR
jgi:hypothetical protein